MMEAHDLETRDKYLDLLQESKYIEKSESDNGNVNPGL